MDNPKTLKPELKEIYERVMNTHAPVRPATSSTAPQTPQPAAPTHPQNPPPPPTSRASTPISMPPAGAAASHATTKGFVFHGNAKNSHPPVEKPAPVHHEEHKAAHVIEQPYKAGGVMNKKIVALSVIFIAIWTVFWMIYFELIKPSTFGL